MELLINRRVYDEFNIEIQKNRLIPSSKNFPEFFRPMNALYYTRWRRVLICRSRNFFSMVYFRKHRQRFTFTIDEFNFVDPFQVWFLCLIPDTTPVLSGRYTQPVTYWPTETAKKWLILDPGRSTSGREFLFPRLESGNI